MDSDEIPLPPNSEKPKAQKTRKCLNAKDQQKAEEYCVRLRQRYIELLKDPDNWKPQHGDVDHVEISFDPLPNNFDTSLAYAKLRKDFRERQWVIGRYVSPLYSDITKPAFYLYPVG